MAKVDCFISATPAQVFAVLADGWSYSNWVVGTSHMRAVDSDWPAVGSKLYHASGVWPVVLRDESVVEAVETDVSLTLIARGRPLGQARVAIELSAESGGTRLTMVETPVAGPGRWIHSPVSEAVLARRNVEALARLTAIVERRTRPTD